MANIWIDKENEVTSSAPVATKNWLGNNPARMHNGKKQAFGELKNLLNTPQQVRPTNFKGSFSQPRPFSANPENLYATVLKKEHMKIANVLESSKKVNPCKSELLNLKLNELRPNIKTSESSELKESAIDIDLFNYFDFPTETCKGTCYQRAEEIWSDMNLPNDDYFDRVMNGAAFDLDINETVIEAPNDFCEHSDIESDMLKYTIGDKPDKPVQKDENDNFIPIKFDFPDVGDMFTNLIIN